MLQVFALTALAVNAPCGASSSGEFNAESHVLLGVLLSLPPQPHHEPGTEMTYQWNATRMTFAVWSSLTSPVFVRANAWRTLSTLPSVLCPADAKTGPNSAFDLRIPNAQVFIRSMSLIVPNKIASH